MIPATVRDTVGELLDTVDRDPTRLPIAEIAAVHAAGYDIAVDRQSANAVVYVQPRPDVVLDRCTPREREVAMLTVGGFSNQQIALALSISVYTVKDHIHAILAKTGMASRAQLIAAWYGGLLTDS